MERMDRLWPGGPLFYYDDDLFPPGTDAFLLGDFARTRPEELVCDLGSGTGLIGLLLLARQPSLRLHNVEREPRSLALSQKTARDNGLAISHHLADLCCLESVLPAGQFDLVVSNPPYFPADGGPGAKGRERREARSEHTCTIDDVCRAAARLLRWGGRLAVVYRPQRLCDLLEAMRRYGMEPKRLQPVAHRPGAVPSLILVEGRRGGRPGLVFSPALTLHDHAGRETAAYRRIYFRDVPGKEE